MITRRLRQVTRQRPRADFPEAAFCYEAGDQEAAIRSEGDHRARLAAAIVGWQILDKFPAPAVPHFHSWAMPGASSQERAVRTERQPSHVRLHARLRHFAERVGAEDLATILAEDGTGTPVRRNGSHPATLGVSTLRTAQAAWSNCDGTLGPTIVNRPA